MVSMLCDKTRWFVRFRAKSLASKSAILHSIQAGLIRNNSHKQLKNNPKELLYPFVQNVFSALFP